MWFNIRIVVLALRERLLFQTQNMNSLSVIIIIPLISASFSLQQILKINSNNKCELSYQDGIPSAVQCKGEPVDGRCFCYSPSGSRIFGWSWRSSSDSMTCACSRERHRLIDQLKRKDVSLHCTENGNYEELQCDNKMCWCVSSKTGKPIERLYPQSMMKHLPCFAASKNYLRQCESKALARQFVLDKLGAHGTFNSHIDIALCDDDGSYKSFKYEKNNVYCTWKDSKKIANYQSNIVDSLMMNCNCARDEIIYAEANLDISLACQGNGNYMNSQWSNGRPYCVDSDGCATTDLGDIGEIVKCPT